MYLLEAVQSMQIVDILRSGALIVAFLSVIIGNRKDRNAVANWLLVDVVATGGFGLGWLLFPDTLLGYMVTGKLDPIHLLITRFFGAILISWAVVGYQNLQDQTNRGQNLLIKALTLAALIVCMCAAQYKGLLQKEDKPRFNFQHVTFGILGACLWYKGNMLAVIVSGDYGTRQSSPLSFRSCANACALLDMFLVLAGAVCYLTVPSYALGFVALKKFKIDAVHLHMYRAVGVLLLGSVFSYLSAFLCGSEAARRAEITRRLITGSLVLPLVMAYQWWYTLLDPTTFATSQVCNVVLYLNICWAYYMGRKEQQ